MLGPPEEVGNPGGRKYLCQVRHGIDRTQLDQTLGERRRTLVSLWSQLGERLRGQRPTDHTAQAPMVATVAHERRAPTQLVQDVVEADSQTRTKGLRIGQDRPHVLVARHCVDAMCLEPDDRTEIPQGLVVLVGLGECVVAVQVGVVGRNRPGAAHGTKSMEITASTWRSTSDGSSGSTPVRSRHSGARTKMVAAAPVNR